MMLTDGGLFLYRQNI